MFDMLRKMQNSILDLKTDETVKLIQKLLDQGVSPDEILKEGLTKGMKRIGEKFEKGEYFVSDLIWASEILKKAFAILQPKLTSGERTSLGTMVIGSVAGDIHDIGKNIFSVLAKNEGFEIIDLGVDVSPEKFVHAVRDCKGKILGLSCLLSTTMTSVPTIIELLKKEKLRHQVKVIVGGAPIDDKFAKEVGADAGVNDAMKGLKFCLESIQM